MTIVFGLAAALLWGIPDIPLAVAVRRVGEIPVLVWSLAIGLVASAPLMLVAGTPHVSGRGLLIAATAGAVTVAAYLTAFTSFQTCPVSIVTPILSCEGAVAAVIAVAFGERPSTKLGVLLAIAVFGVILVGVTGGDEGRSRMRGILFVSLAAIIWGVVLALETPVTDELGVWWGFLLVRAFTFVFAVVFALGRRSRTRLVPSLRAEPWRIAVWGISDAGAYASFYIAAHNGPLALASVLAAQFAVFGSIAAVVILGERLRRRQWLGVVIVVAAVSGIASLGY